MQAFYHKKAYLKKIEQNSKIQLVDVSEDTCHSSWFNRSAVSLIVTLVDN